MAVAVEVASEDGSPMISPSPSGSLHYAETSSPSGSVRQHSAPLQLSPGALLHPSPSRHSSMRHRTSCFVYQKASMLQPVPCDNCCPQKAEVEATLVSPVR